MTIFDAIEAAKAVGCSECAAPAGEWCRAQPAPPTGASLPGRFVHAVRLFDGGVSLLQIYGA